MAVDFQARAKWYINHRIEYLQNHQAMLKQALEGSEASADYDAIKEFLETRGRIQELENIQKHMTEW